MHKKTLILALLAGITLSGAAQATLIDRGSGLIYDDVLNITWLQDANYAKTSGYDADGAMTWGNAMNWAATLMYDGLDDWRLPANRPVNGTFWDFSGSSDGSTDRGYNITSVNSELAYMYYVNLGLTGEYSISGVFQPDFGVFGSGSYTYGGQTDIGLINNIQSAAYWSSVELTNNLVYIPNNDYAWMFNSHVGSQTFAIKEAGYHAWAVRDGDVASIPEPSTLALLMAGFSLIGFQGVRGKKAAHHKSNH